MMRIDVAGGPCSRRLIDHHGRNEGCRGRLVVECCRVVDRPGGRSYVPDPEGPIRILVCRRCGQAHGLTDLEAKAAAS